MVQSLQAGDIREAQVLLDATECTCPNGMLWRGIFDNRGEWYKVPEWIVIEPDGLVEEEDLKDEAGSVGEDDDKEVEVEELGEDVTVKCRLSSTGRDYQVDIRKGERVGGLVTKLKVMAGVSLSALRCKDAKSAPKSCSPTELTMSTAKSLYHHSNRLRRQSHRREPAARISPVLELRREARPRCNGF